jgi:hypothetical protein
MAVGGAKVEGACPVLGLPSEEGVVATKPITPRLADRLCSLAESQLQMQTARSAALDGGVLGVIAVDAGVAAIVIGTRGAYELWIVAMVLLGLSLGLAVRTLRLPGAEETGPSVADMREAREGNDDEHELEESVLEDLARDIQINEQALARKGPLFDRALTFLVLAILVELAGRVVQ